jgi:hypothetical protein
MMLHDSGDFLVSLDLSENALTDRRVPHLSTFIERKGSVLFKKTRRKPNPAKVMNDAAQVG